MLSMSCRVHPAATLAAEVDLVEEEEAVVAAVAHTVVVDMARVRSLVCQFLSS